MGKISTCFFIFCVTFSSICLAQSVDIEGQILAESDVEGVHVINRTSNKFTTTSVSGSFVINAKLNDTIVFSSLQYKLTAVKILPETIASKRIVIRLEEQVNVLDQVTVGKVLTGDLELDIKNSDLKKPIDFYDVGIPGYTGKPKTQSERRLYEADGGKMFYVGFGAAVNFHKLMNAISGRTKMLKERVRLEANEVLMYEIKANLTEEFFKTNPLDEESKVEFFYFCSEDETFESRCRGKSEIEVYMFLEEKYIEYRAILEEKKD